jgi:hypothetical protein
MLRALFKEPLLHFLLIALAIFAVQGLVADGRTRAPDAIVVSAPKIEQMATLFTRTWHRPPREGGDIRPAGTRTGPR